MMGFFLSGIINARYIVFLLDNDIKKSKVNYLMKQKLEIL